MKSHASILVGTCSVLALLSAVGGCASDANGQCSTPLACTTAQPGSGGTSGAGGAAAGSAGGAAPSQYATFANVAQIAQVKCGGSGCHSAGGQTPLLYGVDNATLYSTLKSYVVKGCGNHPLIKPGSPQESAFYLAQRGQCDSSVPQMPLGCVDNCTPPDFLEGVRQWIANGALQQ